MISLNVLSIRKWGVLVIVVAVVVEEDSGRAQRKEVQMFPELRSFPLRFISMPLILIIQMKSQWVLEVGVMVRRRRVGHCSWPRGGEIESKGLRKLTRDPGAMWSGGGKRCRWSQWTTAYLSAIFFDLMLIDVLLPGPVTSRFT
jgi:hypothetical protein